MKICAECKFSKRDIVEVAPGQGASTLVCTHEECRDPVQGGQIPAMIARQQVVFCGFGARYFEAKAGTTPASPSGEAPASLIQVAK